MSTLVKHGIPMEMTPLALCIGRKVMEELVGSLSAQSETTAKLTSEVIKSATEFPAYRSTAEVQADQIMTVLSDLFDAEPAVSAALYELLKDKVLPYVKDERDYYALRTVRETRPVRKSSDTDTEQVKNEFEEVRTFVTSMFNLLSQMGNLPSATDFPVKVNKAGHTVADLPMLPRGGGSKDGRASKVRKVRWSVDGQDCPNDFIPQDVIRLIWGPGERNGVTVGTLFDNFDSELIYSGSVLRATINGHDVTAFTPKDEVDTEDDDTDD